MWRLTLPHPDCLDLTQRMLCKVTLSTCVSLRSQSGRGFFHLLGYFSTLMVIFPYW